VEISARNVMCMRNVDAYVRGMLETILLYRIESGGITAIRRLPLYAETDVVLAPEVSVADRSCY
jgi:hypothetical protein